MTDTTDIAALRDAAALIAHGYKQRWGCETNEDTGFIGVGTLDHDGDLCPFIEVSVSNWSDEDGDDERLAEFLTLANPVAILALLDQIEAERQRADDEAALNKHLDLAIRQNEGINNNLRRRAVRAEAEIAALKAKLANPVVLPSRFKPEVSKVDMFKGSPVMKLDATGGWLNRTGVIVALNEAGFTVKGE